MAYPDHNTEDLTIYKMVLNRLPFIQDTPSNKSLISNFTLEVMNEMEPCFRIRFNPDTGAEQFTRVGNEEFYSVLHRAVIADIVCIYLLVLRAVETGAGNATTDTAGLSTFLSKVKAGSVEVEYDQYKLKDSTVLAISMEDLLTQYKKNAIRKAAQLGCIIDICDDCSINFLADSSNYSSVKPLIVSSWDDCGCCGG